MEEAPPKPFPEGMADSVKSWAIGTLNQQRNLLSRAVTLCMNINVSSNR